MQSRTGRQAAASLALLLIASALGGCSGGSGDALGGGEIEAMCKAWCQQQKACFEAQFEATYGTLDSCRAGCEKDAGDFYDGYHAPECVDEALTKDICVASLSCAELDAVDYSSCADEVEILDECLGYLDGGA